MHEITFGDRTQKETGHAKDMHCGGATLRYDEKLRGYAIHGRGAKVVTEKRAKAIIQNIAPLFN